MFCLEEKDTELEKAIKQEWDKTDKSISQDAFTCLFNAVIKDTKNSDNTKKDSELK